MPAFRFQKLVRDKLPVIYGRLNQKITSQKLEGAKLADALRRKLVEESSEIPIDASDIDKISDELADVQQVLDDLKTALSISDEAVAIAKLRKYEEKGGFLDGIFVESIELDEGDDWAEYYRNEPQKYPEILEMNTFAKKDICKTPAIEKGVYRHYKGGVYEVTGVACHSETLDWYVIYQSQERKREGLPSIWIRPYEMFTEQVEINGKLQPRFKKIDD